jgi:hypothetical protein
MSTPTASANDGSPDAEPPQSAGRGAGGERPSEAKVRALGLQIFLSPDEVVRRALELAAVRQDDRVAVAGPDSLQAMISLCRAGFERVECAREATCSCADGACDLLLIVGPLTAEALAETLRRTARLLKDGGVLIAQLTGPEAQAAIHPALAKAGLSIGGQVIDCFAGRLVMLTASHPAALRQIA